MAKKKVNEHMIEIVKADITELVVDAIVSSANPTLLGIGEVASAIHRAAGPKLLAECRYLGGCSIGEAKITKGHDLFAKYVIHTVGPVYTGKENCPEAEWLASCYTASLKRAMGKRLRSIAFPCISTGACGYPKLPAAEVALKTVAKFLQENPGSFERVIFVTYDEEDFKIYRAMIGGL